VKVRIRVLAGARRQAKEAAAWWDENRTEARGLFRRELAGALDLLRTAPQMGAVYNARGVRRVMLPQTRYQVFYLYDTKTGLLEVEAIWSSLRGKGPPLPHA
jgi:plasmid stabilization system protein ParE